MGSNKLVLTVLMSLSLLTLSACKQSDKGRTPVRKAGAEKPTGNPNSRTEGNNATSTKPNGTAGAADVAAGDPDGFKVEGKPGNTCSQLQEAAKKNGWKISSVDVPETSGSSKKIKITYYTLDKSEMTNPVLYFNRNAFQFVDQSDLELLAKKAEEYKIDFVLMDMRGSGCSSALPDIKTKTAELKNYGSSNAVADAEEIRKAILKDKQWRILAHRSGGVVALRYVQLYPTSIKSISIADFYPMKNQSKLTQLRLEKEVETWQTIAEEQKVSESDVEKAMKNLTTEKCAGLSSCKVLIDLLGGIKMSQKEQWQSIAKTVSNLADGSLKASALLQQFQDRKKVQELSSIARILDIDSDRTLSACTTALKSDNKSVINSCRLEIELRKGENTAIRSLPHIPLKMDVIKANLVKNEIKYTLLTGGKSTLYPSEGQHEHEEEMGDTLTLHQLDNSGSEVYLDKTILDTLL